MSAERNRVLATRWMDEIWNQRRTDILAEVVTAQTVGHADGMPDIHGLDGVRGYCGALLDAFPELRLTVEDMLAQGNDVVVRWRASATHGGGGLGIPATHRPVEFSGLTWMRFDDDGKLLEGWDGWNQGGVMQRLQAAA